MMLPQLVVFSSLIYKTVCLELEKLQVPQEVVLGGSVVLECKFRLGHKPLYSVKWYKEDDEIFRFMPDSRPNTKSFVVPGLHIDTLNSDMHKLSLVNLTGNATGTYKCEVSTEGPIFETVFGVANMTILGFPDRDPIVTIDKYNYELGEDIFANCTSGKSYPATSLSWYLNGIKAEKRCVNEEGVVDVGNSRFRSFSRIRFRSNGDPGQMTLSCVGTITDKTKPTKTQLVINLEKQIKYNHFIGESGKSSGTNKMSFWLYLTFVGVLFEQ